MSIIEQATKRLEELTRAGVVVPWAAAGLEPGEGHDVAVSEKRTGEQSPADTSAASRPSDGVVPLRAEAPQRAAGRAASRAPVEVDLRSLEAAGYLVPSEFRSSLAEEFRHIKRPLLKNASSKDAAAERLSLIAVTSPLPGDGKTYCAINLAMSISTEIDTSVLLVDADVVRSGEILRRLGVRADKGLLDLLTDPALDLEDVILRTSVPKLALLPSGTSSALSTELLASDAMERLLWTLATRHSDQVVIFDAPPLLLTNEAKVLASRVGQVVMVVDGSGAAPAAVAQAFAAVEQCPNVMSVLNKSVQSASPYGYGYYY